MRKTLATVLRALAARLDSSQAPAQAFVTPMTDFAGSGLTVNVYGCDKTNVTEEVSWAMRTSGGLA